MKTKQLQHLTFLFICSCSWALLLSATDEHGRRQLNFSFIKRKVWVRVNVGPRGDFSHWRTDFDAVFLYWKLLKCKSNEARKIRYLWKKLWKPEVFVFETWRRILDLPNGAWVFECLLLFPGPPWLEFLFIFDFFAPWYRNSRWASCVRIA